MLLTVPPPIDEQIRLRTPYAGLPYSQPSFAKSSARLNGLPQSSPQLRHQDRMSTPHRGLPLPGPMALSGDSRASQPLPPHQSHGYAPLPPQHHHLPPEERPGQDWYFVSKTEEDKRKQQEEATRQEELRLEQRKIEHDMLRESLDAGVPPHLVPLIFAALGGGTGTNMAVDLVHQYLAHLPPSAQQSQPPTFHSTSHMEPGLRRETRTISGAQHAFPQPNQGPPSVPGQGMPPHVMNAPGAYPSPAYQSPGNRTGPMGQDPNGYINPTAGQKPSAISSLPRLTTNQAEILNPPTAPSYLAAAQDRASPSPSIYFHHWQPPSQGPPSAAKDISIKTSPNQQSQPSSTEMHNDSPRKRKAQGPHQPAPIPSSAPRGHSPSFSEKSGVSLRRGGHGRQTSDHAGRSFDILGRPHRQISRRNSSQDGRGSRKGTPPAVRRPSQEPRPEPRQEPRQESRQEPRQEPRQDYRQEHRSDPQLQRQDSTKTET